MFAIASNPRNACNEWLVRGAPCFEHSSNALLCSFQASPALPSAAALLDIANMVFKTSIGLQPKGSPHKVKGLRMLHEDHHLKHYGVQWRAECGCTQTLASSPSFSSERMISWSLAHGIRMYVPAMPGSDILYAVASSLEVLQTTQSLQLLLTSALPGPRLRTSNAVLGALGSLLKVAARESLDCSFASITYEKVCNGSVDGLESDVFGTAVAGKPQNCLDALTCPWHLTVCAHDGQVVHP